MRVRGAPAIGVTAAYGMALAAAQDGTMEALRAAADELAASRPTAVNLRWAIERMMRVAEQTPEGAENLADLSTR